MVTTAFAREIRTSETMQHVHDKPYRLPQLHRQEITSLLTGPGK